MEPILPKWLSTIYQFPSSPFHELTKIVGEESRMKKTAVAESETCFSDLPAPWHILADVNSEEALIPPLPENSPKVFGKTQTKQDGQIGFISTFLQEWLAHRNHPKMVLWSCIVEKKSQCCRSWDHMLCVTWTFHRLSFHLYLFSLVIFSDAGLLMVYNQGDWTCSHPLSFKNVVNPATSRPLPPAVYSIFPSLQWTLQKRFSIVQNAQFPKMDFTKIHAS